jgi:hypothetical protein
MIAVPTGGTIQNKLTVPEINAENTIFFKQNQLDYQFEIEKSHDIALEEIDAPAVIMIQSLKDNTVKYITNKFLLQSVTKPRMERFQIVETFREAHLFFFGERTKVYSITGQVLEALDADAADDDLISRDQYRWSTSLQMLYDTALRGSQLASAGNIATLAFEKVLLTGYPLQLQTTRTVDNPYLTQFQMTWAILDEQFLDNNSNTDITTYADPKLLEEMNRIDEQITNLTGLKAISNANKETATEVFDQQLQSLLDKKAIALDTIKITTIPNL